MGRPWIAFFSQTGSEVANICEVLKTQPDFIVTNTRPDKLRTIDNRLDGKVHFTNNKPTEHDLLNILQWFDNPIITLHGWLRIMPAYICERYEIYNGHPGLITKYPELKGKDPQIRSFEGSYTEAGAVLHHVTAGVDEGDIIMEDKFYTEGLELCDFFHILRDKSLSMWTKFLKDKI